MAIQSIDCIWLSKKPVFTVVRGCQDSPADVSPRTCTAQQTHSLRREYEVP